MVGVAEIESIAGTRFCTGSELEILAQNHPIGAVLGKMYPLFQDALFRPIPEQEIQQHGSLQQIPLVEPEPKLMQTYGRHLFRGSPAANPKTEEFLGDLLWYAVLNGKWVGYDTSWQPGKIEIVKRAMDNPGEVSEESKGIIRAANTGLIRLEILRDKVYACPTEALLLFAKGRIDGMYAQEPAALQASLQAMMTKKIDRYRGY